MNPVDASPLQRCTELDRRLLAAVRPIRVLPTVAWPASLENRLIADYARGHYVLLEVDYSVPALHAAHTELEAIEAEASNLAGNGWAIIWPAAPAPGGSPPACWRQ